MLSWFAGAAYMWNLFDYASLCFIVMYRHVMYLSSCSIAALMGMLIKQITVFPLGWTEEWKESFKEVVVMEEDFRGVWEGWDASQVCCIFREDSQKLSLNTGFRSAFLSDSFPGRAEGGSVKRHSTETVTNKIP